MSEPISDETLAEIRARLCGEDGRLPVLPTKDGRKLLAEVDRLRGGAYAEAVERYAADLANQVHIRSMEIRGGTFSLSLEDAREMTAAYVATARAMLGDAENYSETRVDFPSEKVELELKLAGEVDRYVFTVQRAGKLTPHEARVKAEAERDFLREENDLLRVDVANAAPDHDALADDAIAAHEENERLQDLLGTIWLYVGWRSATRSLTTEERELWADAVDAKTRAGQIEDGEEPHPVADRWWWDDFVRARS